MSNGKGLAITALLFGIIGLGLGTYSVFFLPAQIGDTSTFGIQQTWFSHHPGAHVTNPTYTNITIDSLAIDFFVSSGESVYLLFNCQASVFAPPAATIVINFVLDGQRLHGPYYPLAYFNSDTAAQAGSITLQVATNRIPPGHHNITINVLGTAITNQIWELTLLVQTYIP
jgi:hypothetical protein